MKSTLPILYYSYFSNPFSVYAPFTADTPLLETNAIDLRYLLKLMIFLSEGFGIVLDDEHHPQKVSARLLISSPSPSGNGR